MSRRLHLLTSSTALAVTAALLPLSAGPASAAPTREAYTSSSSRAAQSAPLVRTDGLTVTTDAASSRRFTPIAAPTARAGSAARAASWPVGGGRATLTTHPAAASGQPAQQLRGARLTHRRTYGGTIEGVVDLAAAPTPGDPATAAVIAVRYGTVSPENMCVSPPDNGISFTNTDTDTQDNPVYAGTRITIKRSLFPAARTASWNCAFVDSLANDGSATRYDSVVGQVTAFRQKPDLVINVRGRRLRGSGFTRIPVTIKNTRDTVATAPNVRLSVKSRGVAVRVNKRVGTIKPGSARRGAIFVKDTARGKGFITLTATSRDYRRSVRLVVRPVR